MFDTLLPIWENCSYNLPMHLKYILPNFEVSKAMGRHSCTLTSTGRFGGLGFKNCPCDQEEVCSSVLGNHARNAPEQLIGLAVDLSANPFQRQVFQSFQFHLIVVGAKDGAIAGVLEVTNSLYQPSALANAFLLDFAL